jgi:hypothetical protein
MQSKEGIKKVQSALKGLLLILCSYLILRTINPQFVQIPVSLVTPIGIPSKNFDSEWASLISDAERYQGAAQAAVDNAKQTKIVVDQLQEQRNSLCAELTKQASNSAGGLGLNVSGPYKDSCAALVANSQSIPGSSALAIQIASIDSKVVGLRASVVVDVAKSVIQNGGVAQGIGEMNKLSLRDEVDVEKIDDIVQSKKDFIALTAHKRSLELKEMGALDQLDTVEQDKVKSTTAISIAGVEAKINAESTGIWWLPGVHYAPGSGLLGFNTLGAYQTGLNNELNIISVNAEKITDPIEKQKFIDQIAAARVKINNMK